MRGLDVRYKQFFTLLFVCTFWNFRIGRKYGRIKNCGRTRSCWQLMLFLSISSLQSLFQSLQNHVITLAQDWTRKSQILRKRHVKIFKIKYWNLIRSFLGLSRVHGSSSNAVFSYPVVVLRVTMAFKYGNFFFFCVFYANDTHRDCATHYECISGFLFPKYLTL